MIIYDQYMNLVEYVYLTLGVIGGNGCITLVLPYPIAPDPMLVPKFIPVPIVETEGDFDKPHRHGTNK